LPWATTWHLDTLLKTYTMNPSGLQLLQVRDGLRGVREQVQFSLRVERDLDFAALDALVHPVQRHVEHLDELRHRQLTGNAARFRSGSRAAQAVLESNGSDGARDHG